MALIGNYSLINRSPYRQFANGVSSGYRDTFTNGGSDQNRHFGGYSQLSATPVGYLHPAAWILPKVAGGLTASYSASGIITNGALAQGRNVQSSISASGLITNANLLALVDILSSFSASGSFTNAQVNLLNNVSSNISASGSITNADIQTLSVVLLQADLAGAISITDGQLGAIISLASSSSASGSLTAITNILVNISADIGGPTPLSPEGLANAVWAKDITDYVDSGTAGLKLNNASSAGNPWDAATSTNNNPGTFGALVQKLLTVAKFLGLK